MKIKVPIKSLHIQKLLNAAADFHVKLSGDEQHLFAYLGTIKQREERYDRDISEFYSEELPFERVVHLLCLEESLLKGETLILPFAEPNVGETIRCADGQEYNIDADSEDESEYPSSEFISAVLMLQYHSERGEVTIATGIEEESSTMTGVSFEERSIGSLDGPAETFIHQFIDQEKIKAAPVIHIVETIESFYSPYSGKVIAQDGEVDETDPSLLFTNFDNNGGFVSQRLIDHLGDIDQNSIITEETASRITLPGAVIFRHDCGWNGVMLYAFAPTSE